jgi:hypothetical protein
MNRVEMLHVPDKNIDTANVIQRAAGAFNSGLNILAYLPSLYFDVANPGDRAIGSARSHPGDKDQPPSGFGYCCL